MCVCVGGGWGGGGGGGGGCMRTRSLTKELLQRETIANSYKENHYKTELKNIHVTKNDTQMNIT